MKKYLILFILVVLISVGIGGLVWWNSSTTPVSNSKNLITVVIPKGTSAAAVGNLLKNANVIKSPLAFKIYVQLTQKAGKLLPGEFTLAQDMNLIQLVTVLLKGPDEIWVTIPEGLRHEEIALKFANGLGKTGEDYQQFVMDFTNTTKPSEGYLFPSTYLFPKEASAQKVYQKLTSTFEEQSGKLLAVLPEGLTQKEVVILASLLERETRGNEEKPVVAGIVLKRLREGWPLQIDATVQYAIGSQKCKKIGVKCDFWEPLSKADLEITSPFNTYKYKGLPPEPICNPGLASLQAAVNPQESEYWFYIHDDSGVIHYAKTQTEHAANVRKYLGK